MNNPHHSTTCRYYDGATRFLDPENCERCDELEALADEAMSSLRRSGDIEWLQTDPTGIDCHEAHEGIDS